MKVRANILLTVILIMVFITTMPAATTDTAVVNLTISAIDELVINFADQNLTINSATAGSEPDDDQETTTNRLKWSTNLSGKKVTIETDLSPQKFTLKAEAISTAGGTAAGQIIITDTPTDFVTAISLTAGDCQLQYTASATAAQGTGSDVHTITYTLIDGG